jgi:hypothetical protein
VSTPPQRRHAIQDVADKLAWNELRTRLGTRRRVRAPATTCPTSHHARTVAATVPHAPAAARARALRHRASGAAAGASCGAILARSTRSPADAPHDAQIRTRCLSTAHRVVAGVAAASR